MLKEQILKLKLQGDIEDSAEVLEKYSHDASLFEVKPEIIVYPKNVEDIKKLVVFTAEQKKLGGASANISLTPRSAGTDMSGGPLNDSIILDFTRYFNHIIEVGGNFAITEPGVFYRDFEKETLKKNLLLPPYPASREICSVGGMFANNSAGEKTLTAGKVEDYVLEFSAVLADGNQYDFKPLSSAELKAKIAQNNFEGEFYKNIFNLINENYAAIKTAKPAVSKNSAGYFLWNVYDKEGDIFDLSKLFVGSQGTLGIITKIKYRLVKPDTQSEMLVVFMRNFNNLSEVVNEILKFKPESFESYDDKTLELALKYLPELIKIIKPKNILKLGFSFLPEAGMVLTGGFPKLILMAEFTGNDSAEIHKRVLTAQEAIAKFGLRTMISDHEDSQKYCTIRRESFSLLRNHIRGRRTAPFIDDIIVRPEFLPEFLPKVNALIDQYKKYLTYTIAGHVGNGNFHIIPLMDFKDPKSREIIAKLSDEVYDLVLQYKGSITAEHNDGLIRTPYLKQMYGAEIYGLFEKTKNIFDPQNIFNPRKKVGTTIEYALEHMVKTS